MGPTRSSSESCERLVEQNALSASTPWWMTTYRVRDDSTKRQPHATMTRIEYESTLPS